MQRGLCDPDRFFASSIVEEQTMAKLMTHNTLGVRDPV
jgi:hypothetical protein